MANRTVAKKTKTVAPAGKRISAARTQADTAPRASDPRFEAIFNSSGVGIAIRSAHDRTLPYLEVNDQFCKLLGYTREELLRLSTANITPADEQERAIAVNERLQSGAIENYVREKRIIRKDGRSVWVNIAVAVMRDADGLPRERIAIYQDISERKQAEDATRLSEERLDTTFEQAGVGMGLRAMDPSKPHWIRVNQKLCDILGYTREELLKLTTVDLTPPEDRDITIEFNQRLLQGEIKDYSREKRYVRKDGKIIWVNLSIATVRGQDGRPAYAISVIDDITENKRAQELVITLNAELEKLSRVDGLTGIANRRCLDEILHKEWLRALRNKSELSVILIDIDFFKLYNDNYGHVQGDECLKKVARTLNSLVRRPGDLVARYGGEEFGLVLPDTKNAEVIANKCRQAIEELQIPHEVSEAADVVTISVGFCTVVPEKETAPSSIIDFADKALYQAKVLGRNRVENTSVS